MLRFIKILSLTLITTTLFKTAKAQIPLLINELMASNSSTEPDPQDEYDDWIEIYNYGASAVDMSGMYLTDDLTIPAKWQFPNETTLSAGEYLLIWADGDIADAGLHTNFKLSADGEEIGLFDIDGVSLIDSTTFGEQTTDISYGRFPDASDNWRLFYTPTPGIENNGAYSGEVQAPIFSHERGFYDAPFAVTIATETEGAEIYYSLDGSEPDLISSRREIIGTLYTEPIIISGTTCLRARAVKPGWKSSNVQTHTYIFLNDVIRQDFDATVEAGFPTSWGSWSSPDYGMDTDIIGTFDADGNPAGDDNYRRIYANTIRDDLKSIPTLSIVMNIDDMFGRNGIYSNSTETGIDWERPTSVELIYPDGTEGFQINCGIRIQGGYFRLNNMSRKHSFRLLFKGIYGPTKLEFSFFGEGAADSFETIVLRAGANDGYAWDAARYTEQYTRDEFCRRLQLATGHAGAHGNFVHLYINGFYWGLYNPCERPDNAFSAGYYGGEREDWDAIHEGGYPGGIEVTNGDFTAWEQTKNLCREAANSYEAYQKLQGKNPDGTPNLNYPVLLDVTNYVDYLIVNIWAGNWDWPWKNYWLGRDRSENSTGFKFYNWDCENVIGNNLGRSPLNKNALNNDFSDAGEPHRSLRRNPEYQLFFADRVHKFFFNEGILTPESLYDSYASIAAEIESAMVAESARWGDMHHHPPLTPEDWYDGDFDYHDDRAGLGWILNYYIPQRSDIVLQQFRDAGLYPDIDAPVFHINGSYQHGGYIISDDQLSMTSSEGTIYYTLDGSDPRTTGSDTDFIEYTTLAAENANKHVLVPTGPVNNNWKDVGTFDDSAWLFCIGSPGGVGYERTSGYEDFINLDLQEQMYARNASCYIRIPFDVDADVNEFDFLKLNVRYDDGFVAYLNGVEVARRNFEGTPTWDSSASFSNSDSAAVVFENINISDALSIIQQGSNILAIHGMNASTTSSDLLISAELIAGKNPEGINEYTETITLSRSTKVKARTFSGGTWSALNETIYAVGPVAENLRITEIMYHPLDLAQDGSLAANAGDPNEEFIELTNIGTEPINLNLVSLTNGIDFIFTNLELAPGEYAVVVENIDAFESRYGTNITIAGQYSGKLNNNGERIRLQDAIGKTILDFNYNDNWYPNTDGEGFSLTIIDPTNPDPNSWDDKDSWQASTSVYGSPGE
jgi:hypothetical protein